MLDDTNGNESIKRRELARKMKVSGANKGKKEKRAHLLENQLSGWVMGRVKKKHSRIRVGWCRYGDATCICTVATVLHTLHTPNAHTQHTKRNSEHTERGRERTQHWDGKVNFHFLSLPWFFTTITFLHFQPMPAVCCGWNGTQSRKGAAKRESGPHSAATFPPLDTLAIGSMTSSVMLSHRQTICSIRAIPHLTIRESFIALR